MIFIYTVSLLITVVGWLQGGSQVQTSSTSPVLIAIISGLVGGSGATILNYFLTRKQTRAGIAKTVAETEKIRAELNNLKTTVSSLTNPSEEILYDGTAAVTTLDFKPNEAPVYGKDGNPEGPVGLGKFTLETGGVLNVERKNTEGRFEIYLKRYLYKGKEEQIIPPDVLISGQRKLHVICEAKASSNTEHVLEFVIRDPQANKRLADWRSSVNSNQWTKLDTWLAVDPSKPAQFRIDDRDVSRAPSSVQIRNIVLSQLK